MTDTRLHAHMATDDASGLPLKPLTRRPAEPRKALAATVTDSERQAIDEALSGYRWGKLAVGCRIILMAFARSAEVRDAVARWFRQNAETVL